MRKEKIVNILLIIFICIFIYSGANLLIWLKSDKETKEIEEGLYKEIIQEKQDTENNEEQVQYVVDFAKLREINPDIFAWIKIDNTYINYPILQGATNEYYLKKDIYKKYSSSGSIFVYSDADKTFSADNTVIFGHNMKNERMFANLYNIYKGELGKNVNVQIYTEGKATIYKIFSCYIENPNADIVQYNFTPEAKREYIDKAISRSNIDFEQQIDYDNKLITLVTCAESSKQRVIVHAISCTEI